MTDGKVTNGQVPDGNVVNRYVVDGNVVKMDIWWMVMLQTVPCHEWLSDKRIRVKDGSMANGNVADVMW